MNKIDLQEKYFKIVQKILQKYPYKFYVFGSRATGSAKKTSDLDLAIKEPIPTLELGKIYEDFDQSNLPYLVDIVDLTKVSQDFVKMIQDDLIEFPK